MNESAYLSRSPRATERYAAKLARSLEPGTVLALVGELGAGKTCFVRGLARGLGVPSDVPVTSPTFAVMNTYHEGRLPLFHFDLYRLEELDELEAIGYRDFLGANGICVLEWADRIPEALPAETVWIHLSDEGVIGERTIHSVRGPSPAAPN